MGCSDLCILMRLLIVGAEVVHVYVSPFCILCDQCLAAIYALSDLGLEVSCRIFLWFESGWFV